MALPTAVRVPVSDHCTPFCFKKIDGAYLLTNATGAYAFLDDNDFVAFVENKLDSSSPVWSDLSNKGFVRATVEPGQVAATFQRRKRFLDYGPNLHVVEVTLRCNETCTYCHS